MNIQSIFFAALLLFLAYVMEHLPMPGLLSWLQPAWVLLVLTALIMHSPSTFTLWLAIPLGLLLDIEHSSYLGLHVAALSIHIYVLQLLYRRIAVFNFLQVLIIVALLIALHQLFMVWAVIALTDNSQPLPMIQTTLTSALLWPWIYGLTRLGLRTAKTA